MRKCSMPVGLLTAAIAGFCAGGMAGHPDRPQTRPGRSLGIGFLWTAQSQPLAGELDREGDFVDTLLDAGKLGIFRQVKPPVRVSCIALSLERNAGRPFRGVKETIDALREAHRRTRDSDRGPGGRRAGLRRQAGASGRRDPAAAIQAGRDVAPGWHGVGWHGVGWYPQAERGGA